MIVNFAERAHNHNWALDPVTRSLLDTGSGTREAVEQADARVRSTREAIKSAQAAGRAAEFEQAEAKAAQQQSIGSSSLTPPAPSGSNEE